MLSANVLSAHARMLRVCNHAFECDCSVLHKVDDEDVFCKSAEEVQKMIAGEENTVVRLGFAMEVSVQNFSTHCFLLLYWHVARTLFEHIGILWPNPSQPEAPTSQVTFPKRKCCDSPFYAAVTNLLATQIPAHRSSAVVATALPGEYLVRRNSVDSIAS